ncbi:hypothetical protein [Nocardioides marmotae]|uniref:hypothetical protein n=1 Tax=Nocardioides marmotae TaxID=2663857 RepID=UPI0012B5300D|nr:hypothetical protein [Nocardioides marmotae]MBC9734752.1 hypothetical protein [Nocardioides marmotae]MTB85853.1 hypothetical protein [Nocardioides marmotae]
MSGADRVEPRSGWEACSVALVGGHEGAGPATLRPLLGALRGALDLRGATATEPGWPLHRVVRAALADGEGPVAVVPMTWGRDPVLVADTAKTLRWLSAGPAAGRLALCDPFGKPDHLVTVVRAAAREWAGRRPRAAMLLAAEAANPFDDAELHRLAHLVHTHGAGQEVGVGLLEQDGDLARAVDRMRRLGHDEVVVVPAGFADACPEAEDLDGVTFHGPLLSGRAAARTTVERIVGGIHRLGHGEDGIEPALQADHGHGYAHSHAGDLAHQHGPGQAPGQAHGDVPGSPHQHTEHHDRPAAPTLVPLPSRT